MTDRFDPQLYEELKLFAIRLAERTEEFKKLVLRANDVENTAEAFDGLMDVMQDTRECLEEQLGEGAFDDVDETDDDPSGDLPPDSSDDLEEDEIEEEEEEEDLTEGESSEDSP